ncbi:hypothetical protein HMSSN139_08440 [Paenibacillus sp. HMSSN-139]|nr:hypothetical protein HMSSN139_08440 [Paenibacillus sp. HMSSN-139]
MDFAADWFMLEGSTRPFLRSEWSQVIGNAHQLQLMAMDLTAAYSLGEDMDFGTVFTDDSRADMWATSAGAGAGFAPIGDATLDPFTGQLDGQGHAVRGLIINRPGTGQVGLIGYLGDGGRVHGIGVDGGRISGGYSSGGLIGDNRGGTVEWSYSTATVSGTNNVGVWWAICFLASSRSPSREAMSPVRSRLAAWSAEPIWEAWSRMLTPPVPWQGTPKPAV